MAIPAACWGVVAVMVVALTNTMWSADAPPKVTDAPVEKFWPVIVTFVPPNVVPLAGVTPPTRGAVLEGPVADPLHAANSDRPHVHDLANTTRNLTPTCFEAITLI
jgi:hypothetical protein